MQLIVLFRVLLDLWVSSEDFEMYNLFRNRDFVYTFRTHLEI